MGNLKYKGYIGSVEYSEEDKCLFGKVIGLNKCFISYEGQTVEELNADFEEGVNNYLESCTQRGVEPCKSYSGSLNVRLNPDIHSQLAAIAQKKGISINAVIKGAIIDYTKHAL